MASMLELDFVKPSTSSDRTENIESDEDQALRQDIEKSSELLKEKYKKYQECKLLLDAIEECALDEDLRRKVNNILLEGRVSQFRLNNSENVLGVTPDEDELTHLESVELLMAVQKTLNEKAEDLESYRYNLYGRETTAPSSELESPFDLSNNDSLLFVEMEKFQKETQSVNERQTECLKLLEKLNGITSETGSKLANMKVMESELTSELNSVKSQLAEGKCRLDVVEDSSNIYKEMVNYLEEEEATLNQEIEDLNILNQKYNEVSCKEYKDILESYLQYVSAIDKLEMLEEIDV